MQITDVRWVVYWAMVVSRGGNDSWMACWKVKMLSDSVYAPHVHCFRCILVMIVSRPFMASKSSCRVCMRVLIYQSFL